MEINEFGRNLNIVSLCEVKSSHGWASFSFWRSVEKFLPEATFAIACKRGTGHPKAFDWTYKVDVPLLYFSDISQLNLECSNIFSPFTVATRCYESSVPISSKSNDLSTFVTYLEGVGSFVIEETIDILEPPFGDNTFKYTALNMTINESIILKHWYKLDKFSSLY